MNEWSKEDLEEMCGDDVIDQLAFLSGCCKHRLSNDKDVPDGWIIPDEVLRKFAELIVKECSRVAKLEVGTNRVCDAIEEHFGVEE